MNGWAEARNVLAVRLDSMGDVLMTGPAIQALAESRQVTVLTSPAGAAAAALLPGCSRVITYEAPWMKATPPRSSNEPDHASIERLRREGFDAAVIFTVFSQNPLPAATMCLLAGIPLRLAHCRENPYQLLTDWIEEPEPETMRHEVKRQLDLVAAVGCTASDDRMQVAIPREAEAHVRQTLRWLELNDRSSWAVVHPGASAPSRRYPAELFAEACRELAVEHGVSLLFTGSEEERPLVEAIRDRMDAPSQSLAGELSLGEMAALLAAAPLLIANNTGPVHLASAVGCPVVDLYALTNPQHTPWRVPHRVLNRDVSCRWCFRSTCPQGHHDCLRKVPPRDVVRAALELIGGTDILACAKSASTGKNACATRKTVENR
ncbi:MAG TPA: glycosyltransferase family 9 protein [Urbifossiella sp.]|nr:glycosyltransferase family 9 protein [Urbifossiella sp.]